MTALKCVGVAAIVILVCGLVAVSAVACHQLLSEFAAAINTLATTGWPEF